MKSQNSPDNKDKNYSNSSQKDEQRYKTLEDYYKIIISNIWYVIIIGVVIFGLGMFKSVTSHPVYQSSAKIMIEKKSGMSDIFQFGQGIIQDKTINNELEILNSRELKARLIISLWDSPLKSNLFILGTRKIDTTESFLTNIKEGSKDYLKSILTDEKSKTQKSNRINQYKKLNQWVSNRIEELPPGLTIEKLNALVSSIDKGGISINHQTKSTIISINYKSKDKEEAQLVLEKFINIYQNADEQRSTKELTGLSDFLDQRVKQRKKQLKQARKELERFQEESLVFGVSEENKSLIEQVNKIESEYYNTQAEVEIQQKKLDLLKSQLSEKEKKMAEKVGNVVDTELRTLRGQLVKKQTRLAKTINEYSVDHPEVDNLRKEIEKLKQEITQKTKNLLEQGISVPNPISFSQELAGKILNTKVEVEALQAKEDQYKKIVNRYRNRLESLPKKQLKYAKLNQELEVLKKNYLFLREKQQETQIKRNLEAGKIRIIDHASIAEQIEPNHKKNFLLYLFIGLGLGIGFVLIKDMVNDKIKSLEDLEKSGLPIFATISDIGKVINNTAIDEKNIGDGMITYYHPLHPASEAFRNIRTNINLSTADRNIQSILISSPGPTEGKTLIASNLGIAYSNMEKNTLLVDCDLRKSNIHNQFGLEQENGLIDYLTEDIPYEEVIKETGIENLSAITAGGHPPNPSELIGSEKMDGLIQKLEREFDNIIYDTPPILPVTDSVILAKKVDFRLLTVMIEKTHLNAFYQAKQNIERVNIGIDGLVANKVKRKHSKQSKYDYSYDKYYRYYQDKSSSTKNVFQKFVDRFKT